ncbi:MAG: DUF6159 family protein [Actinomycetota bacterium]
MQQPTVSGGEGGGGRIRRGFRLVKVSWSIVKAEKGLMLLPVISVICALLIMAAMTGLAYGLGGFKDVTKAKGAGDLPPIDYVLFFVGYLLLYFVGIYFNAVVIGVATIRLKGGDPTLSDGFKLANSKLGKIFGWSLIAATVGLLLQWLDDRAGIVGRIVIAIVGFVWSLATFFVVPVLLYEPVGVFPSLKRSWSIVKQRWGEQIVGNAAIGIAVFLFAIPVLIVCGLVTAAVPPVGIALFVISIAAMIGIGGALSGVFNAALYQFATTGQAEGGFSQTDLEAAFRPKRKGGFFGG